MKRSRGSDPSMSLDTPSAGALARSLSISTPNPAGRGRGASGAAPGSHSDTDDEHHHGGVVDEEFIAEAYQALVRRGQSIDGGSGDANVLSGNLDDLFGGGAGAAVMPFEDASADIGMVESGGAGSAADPLGFPSFPPAAPAGDAIFTFAPEPAAVAETATVPDPKPAPAPARSSDAAPAPAPAPAPATGHTDEAPPIPGGSAAPAPAASAGAGAGAGSRSRYTTSAGLPARTPLPQFASWEIDHNRFQLKKILGRGSYGAVAEAHDHLTNQRVAIKQIKDIFSVHENAKRIYREIRLLRQLDHENVVKIVHVEMPPNPKTFTDLYIVFECMDLDLAKLGKDVKQSLTLEHVKWFLYQLVKGLKYVHSAGIIHRDIKPANILLSEACDLKICDFGLARGLEAADGDPPATPVLSAASNLASPPRHFKRQLTKHVVTRWYRAPELPLNNDGVYDIAIDMWSTGCILAEMLQMTSTGPARRSPLPLFPGGSCAPLSRSRSTLGTSRHIKKDQLTMILDIVGTPRPEEFRKARTHTALEFLRNEPPRPAMDFRVKYPEASTEALDLLVRMLKFFPQDRITMDEALSHPFFASIRDPASEISFPEELHFESVTRTTIRPLMIKEIEHYYAAPKAAGGVGGGPSLPPLDVVSGTAAARAAAAAAAAAKAHPMPARASKPSRQVSWAEGVSTPAGQRAAAAAAVGGGGGDTAASAPAPAPAPAPTATATATPAHGGDPSVSGDKGDKCSVI